MNKQAIRKQVSYAAPVFDALSDETRLFIVVLLSDHKPRSITQLCRGAEITRQAVTRHLKVLEAAELLTSEMVGRERHYTLKTMVLGHTVKTLDLIATRWAETSPQRATSPPQAAYDAEAEAQAQADMPG